MWAIIRADQVEQSDATLVPARAQFARGPHLRLRRRDRGARARSFFAADVQAGAGPFPGLYLQELEKMADIDASALFSWCLTQIKPPATLGLMM
ncbi:hypothetical protein [Paraburkholderia sp. MM5384-R2]|uniref:hypothetical protein n=1 Tax=Paraburkholderia sp. MM5384-R2 TaxID=2723097 RepID=UPI00160E488C|nr:hypothetical protein [Paraburkholderia sp. MM5384-R2]MBB5495870.1 hypothetical protein [Paraburkholderia sp. MM5384-R2]